MKELLYSKADIRAELRALSQELRDDQDIHMSAFVKSGSQHPDPCGACNMYRNMRQGINRVIRHFGGKVRRND
jgi:hypothetical protein